MPPAKPSESRWRAGRLSVRAHSDLTAALKHLAKSDRRTLSQYVEGILVETARKALRNRFNDDGSLVRKDEAFVLRKGRN